MVARIIRPGFLSHPGSGRNRVAPVPDSERELKPLKKPLKIQALEIPIPLRQSALELEARVGIGRVPPSTSHSKSTAYGIADALTIRPLRFMSRITPPDFL
jgi:hypothetical protein